jgi:hypothetical protein
MPKACVQAAATCTINPGAGNVIPMSSFGSGYTYSLTVGSDTPQKFPVY